MFHLLTEPVVLINPVWFADLLTRQAPAQIPTLPLSRSFTQVGMGFVFSPQLFLALVLSQI